MADARRAHQRRAHRATLKAPAHFAGMDGEAEAGIAGDVEGAGKIRDRRMRSSPARLKPVISGCSRFGGIKRRAFDALPVPYDVDGDDQSGLRCRSFPWPPRMPAETPAHIGIAAEADRVAMVGRDDDLAIDRAVPASSVEIGFGQKRVVFLGADRPRRPCRSSSGIRLKSVQR